MSVLSIFHQKAQTTKIDSPLDLVVNVASLASNPDKIDPELDKVREITSKLNSNQTPSDSDNTTLLHVYLSIENFLIKKEKVRVFTKNELRERLSQRLQHQLSQLENVK